MLKGGIKKISFLERRGEKNVMKDRNGEKAAPTLSSATRNKLDASKTPRKKRIGRMRGLRGS